MGWGWGAVDGTAPPLIKGRGFDLGLELLVKLLPRDQEVTSSSCGNSPLQKCKVRLHTIDPCGQLEKYVLCEIYINTAAKIDDIDEDNINIIDQGDLIPENLDEQNFENINKNLELKSSHTNDNIIIRPQSNNIDDVRDSCNNDNIIDQDDLIPENLDEQNFESIINNLEFGDDHYVHEFKGFDELGVIFQMKNKNTST
ncbi:hypothetical protein FXO38_25462 [Capsicum annuum]|nr:hypothetical protein FXO38_25462 [Capsicum annuum]KAF3666561.1 hypothetical protein FXO37_10472 [Capsicum annuum]